MLGVEVLTCITPFAADEGKNVSEVPAIPVGANEGPVVEEGRVAERFCVGVKLSVEARVEANINIFTKLIYNVYAKRDYIAPRII